MDERRFTDLVETLDPDRRATFSYYSVEPVAASKSTLLEHLRCFETHEKWTQPPPKEMYYASTTIGADEQAIIDQFLYQELKRKRTAGCIAR